MSLSPAQRHNARVEAERKLQARQALSGADSLHIQKAALMKDVERVRSLEVGAERVAMKRDDLLPRWMPTVEKYLADGQVHQNPILGYCVIWLFDIGEIDAALALAEIGIEQGQDTPDNIKRSLAAFVADEVLAWAESHAECGEAIEPYFSRTFENVTTRWTLHEKIRAKWFKFAGINLLRDESGRSRVTTVNDAELLGQADALFIEAHVLDKKIGVKTMRDQIAARLRKLAKE